MAESKRENKRSVRPAQIPVGDPHPGEGPSTTEGDLALGDGHRGRLEPVDRAADFGENGPGVLEAEEELLCIHIGNSAAQGIPGGLAEPPGQLKDTPVCAPAAAGRGGRGPSKALEGNQGTCADSWSGWRALGITARSGDRVPNAASFFSKGPRQQLQATIGIDVFTED